MGQRTVSVAELKAECINLERAVKAGGLATEADLSPHRPGGPQNSAKDARAWLRYFAVLQRRHARGEHAQPADVRLRADAAVMAALRDEPIRVELVSPVPLDATADGGEPLMTSGLLVYQKSLDALLQVHALDCQIAWLLSAAERIEDAGAQGLVKSAELHQKIMAAVAYSYGLIAWIVTTPGPAMPYTIGVRGDPMLPPYIAALNPIDFPQIAGAVQRHHARLTAIQVLTDRRTVAEGGRRPTWSQFIGSLAIELDADAVQLACHRSLASLLASVQLDNDAKRASMESDDDRTASAATHPAAGTLT